MKASPPFLASFFAVCAAALCVSQGKAEPERIPACVEDGAPLQSLAREFKFTEGPTCDREGNVFFTDQPNNRIMKWSVDGKLSTFLQPSGRANGMFFATDGTLIACADEKNELWAIAPNGTRTVLANAFKGAPLNGPNDVWIHPSGAMYFTDPYYQRSWWTHTNAPQPSQQVYRLASGAKEPLRIADDLMQPNGIIGTADGTHLFVADIKAGRTYRYEIAVDGSLTNRVLFCERGSDGMTLDIQGNLFLTGKGCLYLTSLGSKLGTLKSLSDG